MPRHNGKKRGSKKVSREVKEFFRLDNVRKARLLDGLQKGLTREDAVKYADINPRLFELWEKIATNLQAVEDKEVLSKAPGGKELADKIVVEMDSNALEVVLRDPVAVMKIKQLFKDVEEAEGKLLYDSMAVISGNSPQMNKSWMAKTWILSTRFPEKYGKKAENVDNAKAPTAVRVEVVTKSDETSDRIKRLEEEVNETENKLA